MLAQGRQHGLLELSVRPSMLAAARSAAAGAAGGDAPPDQRALPLQHLTVTTLTAGQPVRGCAGSPCHRSMPMPDSNSLPFICTADACFASPQAGNRAWCSLPITYTLTVPWML